MFCPEDKTEEGFNSAVLVKPFGDFIGHFNLWSFTM